MLFKNECYLVELRYYIENILTTIYILMKISRNRYHIMDCTYIRTYNYYFLIFKKWFAFFNY